MITRDEFNEICGLLCSVCRNPEWTLRCRPETKEWTHDRKVTSQNLGTTFSHAYCTATPLRNSRFGEGMN